MSLNEEYIMDVLYTTKFMCIYIHIYLQLCVCVCCALAFAAHVNILGVEQKPNGAAVCEIFYIYVRVQ